jgi:predicted TIM-barrel fold metal-dependent hydrolase
MLAEREKWLNQTIEEPLDPSLPICDAHHHLWYGTENDYPVEAYLKDISGGHRIRKTVFIESWMMFNKEASPEMQPVGETEFIRNLPRLKQENDTTPEIAAGIVGFADLTSGNAVAPVLEAHIAAGRQRFRGIRHIAAWDASPEVQSRRNTPPSLLTNRKFREGFGTLRRYNLSFDAWLYHPQLNELIDLAREFPDTTIIVNHAGGPLGIGPYASRRGSVFREWKRYIAELSRCDNVSIKLGGLGMRISGNDWGKADKPPGSAELAGVFEPYITWCIECFGVDRCMFESNFPVDKTSYSYTVLWNAFKLLTKKYSEEERLALFYNTASKVYRLDD